MMPFPFLETRAFCQTSNSRRHYCVNNSTAFWRLESILGNYNVDWVHSDQGTFGTRGGELAAAQPYALSRSRGLERWSCYIGICDGVALLPEDPRACPACAAYIQCPTVGCCAVWVQHQRSTARSARLSTRAAGPGDLLQRCCLRGGSSLFFSIDRGLKLKTQRSGV
jgi:hypothetical protein